jgi:hypothetical protein
MLHAAEEKETCYKKEVKAEPHSVWVSSDVDVEITIKPGCVPKNAEELENFANSVSPALVAHGASWARYILFDENGDPDVEFDETFYDKNKKS